MESFRQREKRIVQRQHSDATTTNEKRNDYDPISEKGIKESRNGKKIVRIITKAKTTKDNEKQKELTNLHYLRP
jgi:hypothetical protein